MLHAEIDALTRRVSDVTARSALKTRIRHVSLEAVDETDEGAFLRVVIEVERLEEMQDDDLIALIEAIEASVVQVDDRYPSVRFADAA